MNLGRILPVAIGVALLGLLAWGVTSLLERLTERDPAVVGGDAVLLDDVIGAARMNAGGAFEVGIVVGVVAGDGALL